MPVCKKCDSKFLERFIDENGKQILLRIGRKYCLGCKPLGKNGLRKPTRNKHKEFCVEYKGGKCQLCGYSRCNNVLHLHHIDPATKKFLVSCSYSRSYDEIIKELDKCVLLCANCHGEVHAGLIECPTEIIKNNSAIWPRKSRKEANITRRLKIDESILRQYKSPKQIEKETGISRTAVYNRRKELGIDIKIGKNSRCPSKEELEKLVWKMPMRDIGEKFGVTDNAVKKWCKRLGVKWPKIGYWSKKETRVKTPKPPSVKWVHPSNNKRPCKEALQQLSEKYTGLALAEYFGVTPKLILKWQRQYEISTLNSWKNKLRSDPNEIPQILAKYTQKPLEIIPEPAIIQ